MEDLVKIQIEAGGGQIGYGNQRERIDSDRRLKILIPLVCNQAIIREVHGGHNVNC